MERVVNPQPQEMQRQESLVDTPLIPMTMVTAMPRVANLQVPTAPPNPTRATTCFTMPNHPSLLHRTDMGTEMRITRT